MQHLDITVTLDTHDDAAFAAHSLGVAARLAAWPGMVCAGVRTDPSRATLSGRYVVTGRARSRGVSTEALETSLRRAPAVASIRFGDGTYAEAPWTTASAPRPTPSGVAASYLTAPLPRFEHAA